jgi:uncharacterized membrane protein YidH (DUF202 family)
MCDHTSVKTIFVIVVGLGLVVAVARELFTNTKMLRRLEKKERHKALLVLAATGLAFVVTIVILQFMRS